MTRVKYYITQYFVIISTCILLLLASRGADASIQPSIPNRGIKIIVRDASTHTPLPFAHVIVGAHKHTYHTDTEGAVTIPLSKEEKNTIQVSFIGYTSRIVHLKSNSGTIYVDLSPSDIFLETLHVEEVSTPHTQSRTVNRLSTSTLSQGQSQTMADLLSKLPGIRTLSTGALIEKPIIEGMTGSRIAIIDNGSKLIGQHWGDDHAPEISIPSYARTVVIRGAESVKYGANAIGGIVLINTDLNPTKKGTSLSVGSSYSTNGRMYGGDLSWSDAPIKGTDLRYRVAGKYYRSGDYHTEDYLLYNTGSNLYDLKGDLAFKRGALSLQSHVSHYNAELGIFTGSHIGNINDLIRRFDKGRPDDSFTAPFSYNIGSPKQHIIHTTANTTARWQLTDQDILTGRYAFQRDYRREYDIRRGDYMNVPSFAFKLYSHQLELSWQQLFDDHRVIHAGGVLTQVNNISDTNTKAVPIIPNYTSTEAGLYTIYNHPISSQLFVEAGIRADYRHSNSKGFDWLGKFYGGTRNFMSLSGSLGVKYCLLNSTTIHSNIGLAWRPPEMNELYAKGVHHGEAVYQNGDPDLPTEKALKWSSGISFNTAMIDLEAHAYLHYIHNYIYDIPGFTTNSEGKRIPDTFPTLSGIFPIYNFTSSNGLFGGGDLSMIVHINTHIEYKTRGEWMKGRNLTTRGYFPHIPADRYTHRLTYHSEKIHGWDLRATLGHTYVTKQIDFDPSIDLLPDSPPSYHLIDGEVSGQHGLKNKARITLYLRGDNILNTLYKDYTNRLRFFAHDKGRNITMGVRYTF